MLAKFNPSFLPPPQLAPLPYFPSLPQYSSSHLLYLSYHPYHTLLQLLSMQSSPVPSPRPTAPAPVPAPRDSGPCINIARLIRFPVLHLTCSPALSRCGSRQTTKPRAGMAAEISPCWMSVCVVIEQYTNHSVNHPYR